MRKIPARILIGVLMIIALVALVLWQRNKQELIGGQRDPHGCLTSAGYAFDNQIGACIRAFEMTPDIKRAAGIAVKKVGTGYALTVASFNSYEEIGSYEITLEKGVERERFVVRIKNWQVVSVD